MNLSEALAKVKLSSARTVAITKKQYGTTTKYKELRLSVKQCDDIANMYIVRLEAGVVKVTHECDTSVAKAKQLSLEVQYVTKVAKEAEKLRERVSGLETSICPNVSKGGN